MKVKIIKWLLRSMGVDPNDLYIYDGIDVSSPIHEPEG